MTVHSPEKTPDEARSSGESLRPPPHRSSSAQSPADRDADDDWDADQQDKTIVPLTRAEAERLFGPAVNRPSRVTPFRVVVAQMVLSLGATFMWWLWSSTPGSAALSAFLGGAVCWVPSALFAARLRRKGGTESIAAWMLGEAIKMAATVGMFVAIAVFYHDVKWLPLLIAYLVALKTYWIALALR
jgi:ATP synthase protein I